MDYKNTHKRVKRLESLEFIEPVKAKEVKSEDAKNRAKYYRISEAGMFYVFLEKEWGFQIYYLRSLQLMETI